jgi:hypothetical protein
MLRPHTATRMAGNGGVFRSNASFSDTSSKSSIAHCSRGLIAVPSDLCKGDCVYSSQSQKTLATMLGDVNLGTY